MNKLAVITAFLGGVKNRYIQYKADRTLREKFGPIYAKDDPFPRDRYGGHGYLREERVDLSLVSPPPEDEEPPEAPDAARCATLWFSAMSPSSPVLASSNNGSLVGLPELPPPIGLRMSISSSLPPPPAPPATASSKSPSESSNCSSRPPSPPEPAPAEGHGS